MLLEGFESEAGGEWIKHYLFVNIEESELVSGLIDLEYLTIWSIGVVQARISTWMIIDYFLWFFRSHSR